MVNNPGCVISEKQIALLFGEAYLRGATMHNAISGFKSCGVPFNNNIFQEHNFAASATTERPLINENEVNVFENITLETETPILVEHKTNLSPCIIPGETQSNHITDDSIDIVSMCQPGPSTKDGLQETDIMPTHKYRNTEIKLPALPTATRKTSRKPRAKLPSMVLTCTPVKDYLQQKLKIKNDLIKEKEDKKNKIENVEAIKKKSIKRKLYDSSSSDNEEPV